VLKILLVWFRNCIVYTGNCFVCKTKHSSHKHLKSSFAKIKPLLPSCGMNIKLSTLERLFSLRFLITHQLRNKPETTVFIWTDTRVMGGDVEYRRVISRVLPNDEKDQIWLKYTRSWEYINEENRNVIFPQFLWVTRWMSYKKQEPAYPSWLRAHEFNPGFWWVSFAHLFIFCVVLNYVSWRSEFRVVMSVTIST
jgi:hypothetical protein